MSNSLGLLIFVSCGLTGIPWGVLPGYFVPLQLISKTLTWRQSQAGRKRSVVMQQNYDETTDVSASRSRTASRASVITRNCTSL